MVLIVHVDEIRDDYAADVPQPHLARDLCSSFQIGLENGVGKARGPGELPSVNIDHRQSLSVVDHKIAAAGQPYLASERPGDLLFQPVRIEGRLLARMKVHPIAHGFGEHLHKIIDLLKIIRVVHDKLRDILGEMVAHKPKD